MRTTKLWTSKTLAKRIAVVLKNLQLGGVQKNRVNLIREWVSLGITVDVLTIESGVLAAELPKTVTIITLKSSNLLLNLLQLLPYLRRCKPDVLLVSVRRFVNLGLWLKRLAGYQLKTFLSLHVICQAQYPNRDKLPLVKRRYEQYDRLIAVSAGVAQECEQYLGLPQDAIEVIYNPVVNKPLFISAKDVLSHPWLAPKEMPIIIAIGRLDNQKRFDLLLQAFAQLNTLCRLWIIGAGKEESRLRKLISQLQVSERVQLLGEQTNPYRYLARSDLLVMSSDYEGLGNVLIEAMALGVPVVSTDCPSGPREILKDGKYGRLVPVGDVNALVDGIEVTLKQSLTPSLLQQGAERFRSEVIAENYLSLFFQ